MRILFFLSICFLISSCNTPEPVQKTVEAAKRVLGMAFQKTSEVQPSPTPADTAKAFQANAEILNEMIQVVFNQTEIEDQEQFKGLLSSLNQGASLEGIYRGLVMGSRYRLVESKAKAASPLALKFFAIEMAKLQMTMRYPTRFNKDTAKDYPNIEFPDGADATIDFNEPSAEEVTVPQNKKEWMEQILADFIGATPFTLKRVLADEVLKKIDEMKESPGEMAQWYSTLTLALQESKIDFGLELRNKPDHDFHFRYAKTASADRVKWEVLNRYLRILNSMN
jgi:hypothetical protein